jgi:CubicO group peptidase (beta-lactamase class C family)
MKKLLPIFLVFFTLQTAIAQTLSPIVVKHSGINYERLAQIDTLLKQYEDKNRLVGDVVIIVKDNQVVYYKGHGYSNLSTQQPPS